MYRHRLFLVFLLALSVTWGLVAPCQQAAAAVEAGLPLTVVEGGQPRAEIVVAPERPRMVTLAALELQHFLRKTSGAWLAIVTAPTTALPVKIFVGQSAQTDRLGVTAEGLRDGAYRIVSGPNWLVVIGRDFDFDFKKLPWPLSRKDVDRARAEWDKAIAAKTDSGWGFPFGSGFKGLWNPSDFDEIMGQYYGEDFGRLWTKGEGCPAGFWNQDEGGSLNAVYGLLRSLGVRWFMPGELGEVVPHTPTIVVRPRNETVKPDFPLRAWSWYNYAGFDFDDVIWAKRIGMNSGFEQVGPNSGPHGLVHVHSHEAMKQTHPEYYALIGGTRDTGHRDRGTPCFTAQGLVKETVNYIRFLFDRYDLPSADIWPVDGLRLCECEGCRGKSASELVWGFADRVAREVYMTHPNKRITCGAYTSCALFYGPAAKAMKEAITFAEQNLAYKDQSRSRGRGNPANVSLAVGLHLRELLEQARQTAGDSVYGQRIGAILSELQPKEELIAKYREKEESLAQARANAPVAVGVVGPDLAKATVYRLKDNRAREEPAAETTFRVGRDNNVLHFDIVCREPRMNRLQVTKDVYNGDNVAVSLATPLHSYYHLEINPDGAIAEGNPGPDWKSLAEVKTERGSDFWRVRLRIPVVGEAEAAADPRHRVAGSRPTAQAPWYFNVGRRRALDLTTAELQAFSPTGAGWHVPEKFGKLQME